MQHRQMTITVHDARTADRNARDADVVGTLSHLGSHIDGAASS